MATKIIKAQITQRHDTRSNWESVNPVLLEGELGLVSDDPNLYKVGDGRTEWNNLPYRGFDGTLVQEEGTSANAAMSQKAVTEALAKMPGTTGTYPSMHVGTADDLAGRGESVPASFGFRASGGKSIKDGRAYIKRIKGNSVVLNQLADSWDKAEIKAANFSYYDDYAETNLWYAWDPIRINMNMSTRNGHKILMLLDYQNESDSPWMNLEIAGTSMGGFGSSQDICKFYVVNVGESETNYLTLYTSWDQGYVKLSHLRVYDLTKMFQAGNEPTTIEEFNARVATLGIDLNAYNEGQVIHCNTESIKSVGDNAWDEQWRQGYYIEGIFRESSSQIASANPIKVLPNQEYYINQDTLFYWWFYDEDMQYLGYTYTFGGVFKVPANAKYMHFSGEPDYGTTYKNDIMIRLDHSGWKSDIGVGYEPYWQDTLPLPIISKYFPDGMKSAGTAHDEIRYNKATNKWEAVQRIGVLDNIGQYIRFYKGNINYDSEQSVNWMIDEIKNLVKIPSNNGVVGGLLCDKLIAKTANQTYSCNEGISIEGNGEIAIYDSEYHLVGDKNAVQSKYADTSLYYELAEPIVTEITENFRDYYQVADFGTEMSQSNVPSAPFSADIIYQFNAVDMIREHELEITELQNIIATMQAQLASLTNS